jgi:hypothetical protein
VLEVDHLLPNSQDDKDEYNNWQLLHAHCHHYKTGREQQQMIVMLCGYNSQSCEEPDEGSLSSPVLNQR